MILYTAIKGWNSMSKIGELISNIHQYGNGKLYMQSQNPNVNRVLEFSVDDDGKITITTTTTI